MHDIEPHYLWRDAYVSADDERSPHYGRIYDEFKYTNKIYNYFIHPQWDEFGSPTLYGKIVFVDYSEQLAIIELIGEWNDCLGNDVMFFKQNIIDPLVNEGVQKFIVVMDHVLNFHGSDNCYYEEWYEDILNTSGYIVFLNVLDQVYDEMQASQIDQYVHMGPALQIPNWRSFKPANLILQLEMSLQQRSMQLP